MKSLAIEFNEDAAFAPWDVVNIRTGKVVDSFETREEAEAFLEDE